MYSQASMDFSRFVSASIIPSFSGENYEGKGKTQIYVKIPARTRKAYEFSVSKLPSEMIFQVGK